MTVSTNLTETRKNHWTSFESKMQTDSSRARKWQLEISNDNSRWNVTTPGFSKRHMYYPIKILKCDCMVSCQIMHMLDLIETNYFLSCPRSFKTFVCRASYPFARLLLVTTGAEYPVLIYSNQWVTLKPLGTVQNFHLSLGQCYCIATVRWRPFGFGNNPWPIEPQMSCRHLYLLHALKSHRKFKWL